MRPACTPVTRVVALYWRCASWYGGSTALKNMGRNRIVMG